MDGTVLTVRTMVLVKNLKFFCLGFLCLNYDFGVPVERMCSMGASHVIHKSVEGVNLFS